MIKYGLTAKASLLFQYLTILAGTKYFSKALGLNFIVKEYLYRDGEIFWNHDNDLDFNRSLFEGRALNEALSYFLKRQLESSKHLEKTSKETITAKDWVPKDKQKLKVYFEKYLDAYLTNIIFLFSFWNVENILTKQLRLDLENLFAKETIDDILQKLLTLTKDNYFLEEQQSLEKIILIINKDRRIRNLFLRNSLKEIRNKVNRSNKLKGLILKHLEKYSFITAAVLLFPAMKIDNLLERIKQSLASSNFVVNIKERERKRTFDTEEANEIMKSLKKFPEVYKRVGILLELAFWKNQRLAICFKTDQQIKPLYKKVAKIMGLSYLQFVHLTYSEITEWFEKDKLSVGIREIKKRMKAFSLYLKDGNIIITTDSGQNIRANIFNEEQKQDAPEEENILKGRTAYAGLAKGAVRLVFHDSDLKKVNRGDILVTSMTRPEMMVAMEKAAAFVTDEGGILSHAAITSRELKKPCIIATKAATKILKDGDLVEVDANNGIVKILR